MRRVARTLVSGPDFFRFRWFHSIRPKLIHELLETKWFERDRKQTNLLSIFRRSRIELKCQQKPKQQTANREKANNRHRCTSPLEFPLKSVQLASNDWLDGKKYTWIFNPDKRRYDIPNSWIMNYELWLVNIDTKTINILDKRVSRIKTGFEEILCRYLIANATAAVWDRLINLVDCWWLHAELSWMSYWRGRNAERGTREIDKDLTIFLVWAGRGGRMKANLKEF